MDAVTVKYHRRRDQTAADKRIRDHVEHDTPGVVLEKLPDKCETAPH